MVKSDPAVSRSGLSVHLRGHVLLFDKRSAPVYDASTAARLLLIAVGIEVHLDAIVMSIIESSMRESGQVEIRAELPIQDAKNVQVEFGGDTGAIVVGGLDNGRVLPEISAKQKLVARAHLRRNPTKNADS